MKIDLKEYACMNIIDYLKENLDNSIDFDYISEHIKDCRECKMKTATLKRDLMQIVISKKIKLF